MTVDRTQGGRAGNEKQVAGLRAAELVESGMRLGLGTGSTVEHFLMGLSRRLRDGELRDVEGVPTSLQTAERARSLGIPLTDLERSPKLDLTVDGADEVDPGLDLIKGLGGALFREKLVAGASGAFVVIGGADKIVEKLGTRAPLPVEVLPFGWTTHLEALRALGSEPGLRMDAHGQPYRSDNGNLIVDCRFPEGIDDPPGVEETLTRRLGVVTTGLFLAMTDRVFIGGDEKLPRERGGAG